MLITQAEFARLAGVSRSAVKQAINNALITAVVEQNGKTLIDKNKGLNQYRANSRRQRKPGQPAAVSESTQSPTLQADGLELLSWGQAENAPAATPSPQPAKSPAPTPTHAALPEYGKSRARSEFEKANLLELTRLEKEKELVYRKDFEAAQAAVLTNLMLEASSLSRRIRTDIPHLTQEEVDKIQARIDDVFDKVSEMTFEELDA